MLSRPTAALCGFLLLTIAAKGLAEPSLAEIRKKVVDAHSATNQFSISCFAGMSNADDDRLACMGSIQYRYDRKTNQLAIGTDGVPILLVQGNQLMLRVAFGDEEDDIYMVVNKRQPITWRDVDEACQSIRAQIPLSDDSSLRTYCFLLPLLTDGTERLFGKTSSVLTDERRENRALFSVGHPDAVMRIGGDVQQKLDPQRAPWCVRMQDAHSQWDCAFDRDTGMMTAAIGVLSLPQPGAPDAKYEVTLKREFSFADGPRGEGREVPLDLPADAKCVEAADLRAAYLRYLRSIGRQDLLDKKKLWEDESRSKALLCVELAWNIALRQAAANVHADQTEKDEAQLKLIATELAVYEVVIKEFEAALDGFEGKP